LINYCEKKGIDASALGIEGFMLGGEPGGGIPHIRKKIEDAFGATVQECMGNGDMMGLMWGECEHKNGMHFIGQGMVHPEVIDPETGEVLEIKEGLTGRTGLYLSGPGIPAADPLQDPRPYPGDADPL
jgi:phenylacetate-CoA ligase